MDTPTMVLLRHDLPDGTQHFDFMVKLGASAPGPNGKSGLRTWRVSERIDQLPLTAAGDGGFFWAEPLGDHRDIYLTFEGDIGGGRGTVTRVAEGAVSFPLPDMVDASDQVLFEASWWTKPHRNRQFRFAGSREESGSRWRFTMTPC
jgi:hypothetical protein